MRVDRDGKLKAIEDIMGVCCAKALEYFDRANDIFYFPDEEVNLPWAKLDLTDPQNWSEVDFNFKVLAYSGIGNGATFNVSFGSNTFQHVDNEEGSVSDEKDTGEDDDYLDGHSIYEDHGCDSVDADEFARSWECIQNHNFESDSEDDEDVEDSDSDCDPKEVEDTDRSIKPPPPSSYAQSKTLTGVNVTLHTSFGQILGKTEKAKKNLVNESKAGVGEQRSVMARAISIASDCIHTGKVAVQDGKEEMEEYKVARGWTVEEETLCRGQGWARRPNRADGMYGKQYSTDEYRAVIVEMFERGRLISSDKTGPGEIREEIEKRFPGYYCYPGDTEISKAISAMFQRQKDGKEVSSTRTKKMPEEIESKIRQVMEQFPDEKGNAIESRVSKSFGRRKPAGYIRKVVMDKVNAWRNAKKKKAEAAKKRNLIG
jgi:hypothetical protein